MLHSMMEDQAAGLRRMLGKPATKNFIVLSAIPGTQKNSLLFNLASAVIHAGNSSHLIDARMDQSGISARLKTQLKSNLWDLSLTNQPRHLGFYEFMQGGRISQLASVPTSQMVQQASKLELLSQTLQNLSTESNIWFIDAELKMDNPFLIPEFAESEVILIVSSSAASIKNGYGQLKNIANTVGRKRVALLVNHTEDSQAQLVYKNIATAAKNYLSIPLSYLGHIPEDDYLIKSSMLGKSIIDAFPLSKSSQAFRSITEILIDQKLHQHFVAKPINSQPIVLEH